MKEVFYEESARVQNEKSAKAKFYVFKVFSIMSYVMMVVWIIIFLTTFPLNSGVLSYVIAILPLVLFFLSGFFLWRIKNRFYLDYDYTFVTGSVRVAKVIKNTKRKLVVKFEVDKIEKIGKYGSETYYSFEKMPGIKKKILTLNVTPDDGKDFYYLVVNVDEEKQLLIFECTETLIVNILSFINNKFIILEKDYK